jgi:hypothetical protein
MGATFCNFEFLPSAFCLPSTLITGLVHGAPHAACRYETRQFPGRSVSKVSISIIKVGLHMSDVPLATEGYHQRDTLPYFIFYRVLD